jgi:hypothetical protein
MREIRLSGSVRGVRRNPYPYRDDIHPVRSTERDTCPDFFHRERQHNAISRTSPIPISARVMPYRHRGK